MITNKRDYLRNRHYVLIEIYSGSDQTTFIKYEETTKELSSIMVPIISDVLDHLKAHNIINDYAISSI